MLATSSSSTSASSKQFNRLPEEDDEKGGDTFALPSGSGSATGSGASGSSGAGAGSGGKRLHPDWSVSLGEHARDIFIGRTTRALPAARFDIAIVGEHSVFWLHESGAIKLQKRVDFNPAASCLFASGTGGACFEF